MAVSKAVVDRVRVARGESRVVAVVAGSAFCRVAGRALTLLGASLSAKWSFIGQRVARNEPTRDFDKVIHVLTASTICRAVGSAASGFGPKAWSASSTGRIIAGHWCALGPAARVRLVGFMVFVAAVVRAALAPHTLFASSIALALWLVLLLVAGCIVVFSQSVATAWTSRFAQGHESLY